MNNVVGKMLIVMQLVFSVLFMCFAGAVYTFQGQWKNAAEEAQKTLTDSRRQTEEANDARNNEIEILSARLEESETERDNLRAEQDELRRAAETSERRHANTVQERDKAMADADAATTEAKDRVVEANELTKEVQASRERITDLIKEIQDTEDQLLARSGEVASAVEQEAQHLSEIGRLKDLLRLNDIDPAQVVVGDVPADVEQVEGFVKQTQRNPARTLDLLLVTIGSDDGITKGEILTVFRADKFVCKARVYEVHSDTAVCIVDETTRQLLVKEGDNVTTKL